MIPLRVNVMHDDVGVVLSKRHPQMDGSHIVAVMRPDVARELAAELLRVADQADGKKPAR